jgi:hypothetical protein
MTGEGGWEKDKIVCMSAKAGASFDDDEGRRRAPICNMSHARHITRRNLCLLRSSDLSNL